MASKVRAEGLTVLQDPNSANIDIIFVHGLQGHPENTWTYRRHEIKDADSVVESKLGNRLKIGVKNVFKRRGEGMARSQSPSPSPSEDRNADVFWPRDLLGQHEACTTARIMTYGYDTNIVSLADTCNFTTMSDHGETLLNRIAAKRVDHMHRPLMFITHSLGGLVVKSALNASKTKSTQTRRDLHAVVDSTFAIIFFGTPHRGSDFADFGLRVAKAVSVLTMRPYNDKIVKSLASNTEILTNLRKDFVNTVDYMIERNSFESSTFQEGKGFSGVKGFTGKIVDDDSSEGGRNDRNDHINRNHTEMCKFFGADDPEYDTVSAEVKRHLQRIQGKFQVEEANFLRSLDRLGHFALKRKVDPQSRGTLKWLYGAPAFETEDGQFGQDESRDLDTWLDHGPGLFWITGRPGSGKSTAMRLIFDNASMRHSTGYTTLNEEYRSLPISQEPSDLSWRVSTNHGDAEWCPIGVFITNRGDEEQRRWEPMLHGILLQILKAQPALSRDLLALMAKKKEEMKPYAKESAQTPGMTEQGVNQWSTPLVMEALMHCKQQTLRPFKALIVLDGLDELENMQDAKDAVALMKKLSDDCTTTSNIFRVCVSSRSEEVFRQLFTGTWRIEIHHHTKDDIRHYTWCCLRDHPRFTKMKRRDVRNQLANVLDYVTDNAHGVFLWARSVVVVVDEALSQWKPLEDIPGLLKELPTEMHKLYEYILRKIDPKLRRKAFIMLEVVLRARVPVTLLELSLIVEATEGAMAGRPDVWPSTSFPDVKHYGQAPQLQGQLIASCKCLLEIAQRDDYEYSRYESRYQRLLTSRPEPYRASEDGSETDVSFWESPTRSLNSDDDDDEETDSEIDGEDDVELVNRAQYRNYHNEESLDPSRNVVQLLHRSAKDVLLDPNFLDIMFPSEEKERKPQGNGHAYFLFFIRAWLDVPPHVRQQLRCRFDPAVETIHHAALLEGTLGDAVLYFEVLDVIDRKAKTSMPDQECWPLTWIRKSIDAEILSWHVTFPAVAVAMGMRGYIGHRIRKDIQDRDHFINGKPGRPLLHFSVFFPLATTKPEMTKFLVDEGANLALKFDGKTAIESLCLDDKYLSPTSAHAHLQVMEYLLMAGANPDSRYYPDGARLSTWHPLLHIVAYSHYGIDDGRRIDFMRFLHGCGANLNGTDCLGRTFLDVLYWGGAILPSDEWEWLLRKGARISRSMISRSFQIGYADSVGAFSDVLESPRSFSPFSDAQLLLQHEWETNRDVEGDWLKCARGFTGLCDGQGHQDAFKILRQPRFRRREWYNDDAADAALSLIPTWLTTGRI